MTAATTDIPAELAALIVAAKAQGFPLPTNPRHRVDGGEATKWPERHVVSFTYGPYTPPGRHGVDPYWTIQSGEGGTAAEAIADLYRIMAKRGPPPDTAANRRWVQMAILVMKQLGL